MKLCNKKIIANIAVAVCLLSTSMFSSAALITNIEEAYNSFQSGVVTGGAQLGVDSVSDTLITAGIELPGFAFGTYNVDATESSITMSFIADLASLGVTVYDASTFDRYFFEFDQLISSASISMLSNVNFAASVELVAPGTMFNFDGAFLPTLPTSLTMDNGGILITIGDGTNLNNVGQGGELIVNFTAVPLPPVLSLILFGVVALMWRRAKK